MAHGAFWSLTGAILSKGLGLVSSVFVARMLGKSGYGELGIILSTLGMFGTFAGFGLGMTGTKFIAQYRSTNPLKAGRIRALSSSFAWVTSGITSLILLISAPWIAERTLAAPHLSGLLQIGSLFLLLSAVNGAQIGVLSGFEAFKTVAKISLCSGCAKFPFMVGGVYLAGLEGAVWGAVAGTALNWLLNHIAIRKACAGANIPYTYKNCWKEREILYKFALPSMASSLFFIPTEWVLSAMMVNQPDGYSQMGLFSAAKQWHVLIMYVPIAVSNMTMPILSNLMGKGDIARYKKVLILNSVFQTCLAAVVALPVAIFSKTIMGIYGDDFIAGQNVLVMVCIYSVLWSANIILGQVLWSTGASGKAMILAALRAGLLMGCFIFIVPRTAYGLTLAYAMTYLLQSVYQGVICVRSVNRIEARGDKHTD